jgi:hypothetical protein
MKYLTLYLKKISALDYRIIILFNLIMWDLYITVFGIDLGYIQEGNPLLKQLVAYPLIVSMGIKCIYSLVLLYPIVKIKYYNNKLYNIATYVLLSAYSVVFLLHGQWIFEVLKCKF